MYVNSTSYLMQRVGCGLPLLYMGFASAEGFLGFERHLTMVLFTLKAKGCVRQAAYIKDPLRDINVGADEFMVQFL